MPQRPAAQPQAGGWIKGNLSLERRSPLIDQPPADMPLHAVAAMRLARLERSAGNRGFRQW